MANEEQINSFISPEAFKQLNDVKVLLSDIAKQISVMGDAGIKISGATGLKQITDETTKLTAAQKEAQKATEKFNEVVVKTQSIISGAKDEEIKRNIALREAKSIQDAKVKAALAEADSIDQLTAKAKLLTREYYAMSKAQREGTTEGIELGKSLAKTNDDLNKAKLAVNDFTKNVGNYEGAFKSVRQELKETRNELGTLIAAGAGVDNPRVVELSKKLDHLTDSMTKTKNMAELMDKAGRFQAFVKGLAAVSAAFEVARGATALFGEENEDLQKAMLKVQGAIALTHGLETIANSLRKESVTYTYAQIAAQKAYNIIIGEATGAAKAFRIALAATIAGAVIIAIYELATNWQKVKEALGGATKEQKAMSEVQKKATESYAEQAALLESISAQLSDTTLSADEYKTAIADLDKILGTNLSTEKDLNLAREKGILLIDAKIGLLKIEAEAEAAKSLYAEKYKEVLTTTAEYEAAAAEQKKKGGEYAQAAMEDAYDASVEATAAAKTYSDIFTTTQAKALKAKTDYANTLKSLGVIEEKETKTTEKNIETAKEETSAYKKLTDSIASYTEQLNEAITKGDYKTAKIFSEGLRGLEAEKYAIDEINKALQTENGLIEDNTKKTLVNTEVRDTYTNKFIESTEKQKEKALELEATYEDMTKMAQEFGVAIGESLGKAITDGKNLAEEAGKAMIKFWLKELKAFAEAAVFKATVGSLTTEQSLLTGGIAGLIQAAAITAIIETAYAAIVGQLGGYAEGTESAKPGLHKVSEKGQELWHYRGEFGLTPKDPSIMYTPEGMQIIPHDKLVNLYSNPDLNSFAGNVQNNIELQSVVNSLDEVKRAIINKREVHWIGTDKGLKAVIKNGNSWTEYVNNNILI